MKVKSVNLEELEKITIELEEVKIKLASGLRGNDYKDMLARYQRLKERRYPVFR